MTARTLGLLISLSLFVAADSAHASGTSALAQELTRSQQVNKRVVNVWWLPLEYWLAAAQELKKPAQEIDDVRKLFRYYLIIAVLDARVLDDGKLEPATHAEIGPHLQIRRNGKPVEILRDVDPRVARRVGELSYLLKTSLSMLGVGLRIFFLPNIDDDGRPFLQGASRGLLTIRYAPGEDEDAFEYVWHAPLTAVAGPQTCPDGGESLEAHWAYCPWHGIKLRGE